MILNVDHKLGEEVFLILIDTTEPVVVRDGLHAGHAQDFVAIRKGKRLNDGDAIDDDETVGTGDIRATIKRAAYHGEESEEK